MITIKVRFLPAWVYPCVVNMHEPDRTKYLHIMDKLFEKQFTADDFIITKPKTLEEVKLSNVIDLYTEVSLKIDDSDIINLFKLIMKGLRNVFGSCDRGGIVGQYQDLFLPASGNDHKIVIDVVDNPYIDETFKIYIKEVSDTEILFMTEDELLPLIKKED